MSHLKERTEKTCLNCGTTTYGLYCHRCGQENIEPKIGLGHLIVHFFNDVTHFDGKLFSTAKLLLFKPGFLSSEYMSGRRIRYLDPVRMYLFISATFFIVFFMLLDGHPKDTTHYTPQQQAYIDSQRADMAKTTDLGFALRDNMYDHDHAIKVLRVPAKYEGGVEAYDSIQKTLPLKQRDGWLDRYLTRHFLATYKYFERHPDRYWEEAGERFLHSLSKVVFITLPICILLLGLLYIRRRKEYFLVSHAIFSFHIYAVTFIWLFAFILLKYLPDIIGTILGVLIVIGMMTYVYIAMLRFYNQKWFKTLIKFFILSVTSSVMLIILTLIFVLNTYLINVGH